MNTVENMPQPIRAALAADEKAQVNIIKENLALSIEANDFYTAHYYVCALETNIAGKVSLS